MIQTIRESSDVDTARENLQTRFDLSELQAQAILDMRLARLAALERKKIEDEYLQVIQLIAELEKEKRGIYAGAVGYFGYSSVDPQGNERDGEMDTCIALRTMLVKDGITYLQAGKFCPSRRWHVAGAFQGASGRPKS